MGWWIVAVVAIVGFIVLIVWLLRWRDTSWSEGDQHKAFTWSKKGSGGGPG